MKKLTLKRVSYIPDGPFGVLLDEDIPFAITCEREWFHNQPKISCIPAGTYSCKRVASPKFGNTFEVSNVPGRSAILFHSGNTEDDSLGCILVGEQFGELNGKTAVLSSKTAFSEFLKMLVGEDGFILTIKVA